MFGRFKKKPETKETKALKVAEVTERKPKVIKEPESTEKPSKKMKRDKKPAKSAEDTGLKSPQIYSDQKAPEKPFVGIKEYNSASEIAEKIDNEISETKSRLGEYLRVLDDKRAIAEKAQRLHAIVAKIGNIKHSGETKQNQNQIEINGLEVILDATALNELTAIESVVKSHQQRLQALQKARKALKTLDQIDDTEGIKYVTLEREGIPERILLKL